MVSKVKRVLAGLLAVCMCMSMVTVTTFAAEEPVSVETSLGVVSGTQKTEVGQPVPIADGVESVTVTITVKASETDGSGNKTLDYQETTTIDTISDSTGKLLQEGGSISGSETVLKEQTENVSDVSLTLVEDGKSVEEAIGSAAGQNATRVDNLAQFGGSDDRKFDYTTTSSTDRTVTADTTIGVPVLGSDLGGSYDSGKDIGLEGIKPGSLEGKKHVTDVGWYMTWEDVAELLKDKNADLEGYDFIYVGHGEESYYGAHWNLSDERGETTVYSDGESRWDGWDYGTTTAHFELANPDAPNATYTAYCADIDTGAKSGWWYKVQNLEDSDYYKNEEAENHIRAIVLNGYWGTVGTETDESGNQVPKTGSLAALKHTLNAAIDSGALTTMTKEDVEALTEGQALTATQMAIWEYGNPYDKITLGANSYDKKWEVHPDVAASGDEAVVKELERINAVAYYLMGLSMTAEEANATTIINEKNFVEDMRMTVGKKVEGHDNNTNDNTSDDAYHVDLSFSLLVTPSVTNDDLIVRVIDANGLVAATARIAGTAKEGENFGYAKTITENGKTYYVLEGMTLIEGSNTKFNLKLEGAQYLEQGVYVYSSETRKGTASQTFVGIAEGHRSVNISTEIDLTFHVDESVVTSERVWGDTWIGYGIMPLSDEGPGTNPNNPTDPTNPNSDDPDGDDPQEEGTNEGIPLSDVPDTGDVTMLWMALSVFSGVGLVAVSKWKED